MTQNANAVTIARNATGAQKSASVDAQGSILISQAHALRYGIGYGKRAFAVSNPTPVQTSAGLATTYTGLCVSNPIGSGVNLSIFGLSAVFIAATSAQTTVGLIVGFAPGGLTAHNTPLTPISTFIGSGVQPQALADSACALVGTPLFSRYVGTVASGATGAIVPSLEGGLIIPPGAYVAIGTTAASAASGFVGSIEWEECPQ